MKLLTTLLSAALIAGVSTVAMAQAGGGSGSDLNPNQMGRGADSNPSGLNANPMAGNQGNTMQSGRGQMGEYGNGENANDMNSANVSGQWNDGRSMNGRMDRRDR